MTLGGAEEPEALSPFSQDWAAEADPSFAAGFAAGFAAFGDASVSPDGARPLSGQPRAPGARCGLQQRFKPCKPCLQGVCKAAGAWKYHNDRRRAQRPAPAARLRRLAWISATTGGVKVEVSGLVSSAFQPLHAAKPAQSQSRGQNMAR